MSREADHRMLAWALAAACALACGEERAPAAGTASDVDAGSDETPARPPVLGCDTHQYGVLAPACGDCLCEACPGSMGACTSGCWRLLGCLLTNCDHDPDDPDCAAALCTEHLGAADQLRGFSECLSTCEPCTSDP